ncbi:bifunctional folylpolyglutamate synthase/dihydrofolate synthase [Ferviditalea candida]|uniref:tetrahydrofolate synthase n=1 Tax=Ferviditalea candida TaxID=3108399 RepID=A0ABU5ZD25_9BACL|nr:folylpolyglutamate synthase/dihydrofolate synthase family protein [Paenibacillaceae bacterium T2]
MDDASGISLSHTAFRSYDEAVEWINGLIPFGIRPGLARMEVLMEKLDHPHRRLKFIHVAGTNGKGSVCAYLSSVLTKCGYAVGTFTSPYIQKFTNRIQLNGRDIEEEQLLSIANQLRPLVDEIAAGELGPPTMFEVTTALAVVYFARHAYPDFVVWETGLGGRLDCTNIVIPIVSIITNIGHDHMDILGDSLEKIALEKAGIIKSGVPVISAVEQQEALRVIEREAREKHSTLYLLGREFDYKAVSVRENEQIFHFTSPFRSLRAAEISLNGPHQLKNASTALMALDVLKQYYAVILDDGDLLPALKQTKWPGRLEMVQSQPRILLDGAHNPEGAESLADSLQKVYRYRKLHMMFGMLSTKNHSGYIRHILPMVNTLIVTEPDFRKKISARELHRTVEELLPEFSKHPVEIIVEPDWRAALARLIDLTAEEDLAVVTGTLYLIADVRAWILNQSDCEKGW